MVTKEGVRFPRKREKDFNGNQSDSRFPRANEKGNYGNQKTRISLLIPYPKENERFPSFSEMLQVGNGKTSGNNSLIMEGGKKNVYGDY